MKVFAVVGYTKSGKTTTIEAIIKELKKRGYSVGTVKDIHYEQFAIDTKGTNTYRHKVAGSDIVTARGMYETDILYQEQLDIYKIASFYETDYLILEGVRDANVPMILTADCMADLDERYDGRVFMVSGKIADEIQGYKSLEAISVMKDVSALVDLVEATVFPMLPDYDPKCCHACGYDCRTLCHRIVAGDSQYDACVINRTDLKLKINGKNIPMVPFVQKILKNSISGVVSELDGYEKGASLEIVWGENNVKP